MMSDVVDVYVLYTSRIDWYVNNEFPSYSEWYVVVECDWCRDKMLYMLEVGIKGLTLRRHCHTVRVERRICATRMKIL